MVQRAILKDDSRGVGEPLNEQYVARYPLPGARYLVLTGAFLAGTGSEIYPLASMSP